MSKEPGLETWRVTLLAIYKLSPRYFDNEHHNQPLIELKTKIAFLTSSLDERNRRTERHVEVGIQGNKTIQLHWEIKKRYVCVSVVEKSQRLEAQKEARR